MFVDFVDTQRSPRSGGIGFPDRRRSWPMVAMIKPITTGGSHGQIYADVAALEKDPSRNVQMQMQLHLPNRPGNGFHMHAAISGRRRSRARSPSATHRVFQFCPRKLRNLREVVTELGLLDTKRTPVRSCFEPLAACALGDLREFTAVVRATTLPSQRQITGR
jgi:hypothetical protein